MASRLPEVAAALVRSAAANPDKGLRGQALALSQRPWPRPKCEGRGSPRALAFFRRPLGDLRRLDTQLAELKDRLAAVVEPGEAIAGPGALSGLTRGQTFPDPAPPSTPAKHLHDGRGGRGLAGGQSTLVVRLHPAFGESVHPRAEEIVAFRTVSTCYLQFVDGKELCFADMMSETHDGLVSTKGGTEAPPEQQGQIGTAAELNARAPHAVAFLLSQLGAHASALFAERVVSLDLTPPQVGFLRLVGSEPGSSQQAIAGRLGMAPNRLVHLVDEMEERGLIERRRDPRDRRNHALHLSAEGRRLIGRLSGVAAAHEEAVCAGLTPQQRQQLGALLERVAANQGLEPGIHPGYRRLGR